MRHRIAHTRSRENSAIIKERSVADVIVRSLATVLVAALAGLFGLLGCFLIVSALGALLGAFLIGRHAFVAIAIMILVGIISLVMASGLCLGLIQIWSFRRNRDAAWPAGTVPHVEVRLQYLGHPDCPDGSVLYSGYRAVFRCDEVVDDVTLVLVGASQLAKDEEGRARLTFGAPADSFVGLQEGLEFDILDQEARCICRGTISKILGQV